MWQRWSVPKWTTIAPRQSWVGISPANGAVDVAWPARPPFRWQSRAFQQLRQCRSITEYAQRNKVMRNEEK